MSGISAIDAARLRYISEFPHFSNAAAALQLELEKLLADEATRDARVKVRAKEVSSFVKKLRKYGDDCWNRTTDKVGAQIVTHKMSEVRQLASRLQAGFGGLEYIRIEVKSPYTDDPRALRYSGTHVQVRLAHHTTSSGEPIEAEIQLRTQTQDAWAYLEHGLIYKPVIRPSSEVERRIARLSVLVEMFDEEVDRVVDELRSDPAYEAALFVQEAERWFHTFVSEPGESELSLEVVAQISPVLIDVQSYAARLRDFVEARHRQIAEALRDYGHGSAYENEWDYLLFTQPEALILWEMIENQPLALSRAVGGSDIAPAVRALADVWGQPLPMV